MNRLKTYFGDETRPGERPSAPAFDASEIDWTKLDWSEPEEPEDDGAIADTGGIEESA